LAGGTGHGGACRINPLKKGGRRGGCDHGMEKTTEPEKKKTSNTRLQKSGEKEKGLNNQKGTLAKEEKRGNLTVQEKIAPLEKKDKKGGPEEGRGENFGKKKKNKKTIKEGVSKKKKKEKVHGGKGPTR